jgi:hypothetical protein
MIETVLGADAGIPAETAIVLLAPLAGHRTQATRLLRTSGPWLVCSPDMHRVLQTDAARDLPAGNVNFILQHARSVWSVHWLDRRVMCLPDPIIHSVFRIRKICAWSHHLSSTDWLNGPVDAEYMMALCRMSRLSVRVQIRAPSLYTTE